MKFSIITVNLNNVEGLKRTIGSVVSQTFTDYEWLVIDGGSTDGSKEIVEQNQHLFSYWCSEPDHGIYNAMNKGIVHAKGDYLLFLNSGDEIYDKNVLSIIANLNSQADIISGQVERIDNQSLLRKYHEKILLQLWRDTLNHQGTFIKRSLFKDILYDESFKIVSDWKFWWETLVFKNASYEIVDVVVGRQDMTGISSSPCVKPWNHEREMVISEIIPNMFQEMIKDYNQHYAYISRATILFNNNKRLYSIGSKFLALLVKLAHIKLKHF